ncbi:50S ribosomal protein L10 [Candidatus Gottesmanbacteria bacterium]|nr:50S ribosomal protein L10 [Candidatus Gottesmanbacteria bacterium]
MPSQKNKDLVLVLKEKLSKASTLFLTDYRGLTHQQLEQLRKSLKKVKAEYIVAKNTLLKIALKEDKRKGLDEESRTKLEEKLQEPTATLLSYGDEMEAIKTLDTFIKSAQIPKIKIGFFAGKIATEMDFKSLANLPSRDVLLATLVSRLQSPLYGLHHAMRWNLSKLVYALDAVAKKRAINS